MDVPVKRGCQEPVPWNDTVTESPGIVVDIPWHSQHPHMVTTVAIYMNTIFFVSAVFSTRNSYSEIGYL